MIKLGIFEIGISPENKDDIGVIENTIEYARAADELGYSRFWMGEHHEPGIAWRSPEILMTVIAGCTNRIKVGAAGMLLALNSPLRIAQDFKLLGTIFAGRIDLGIAKGFTSDHVARELLNGLDYTVLKENHTSRTKELLNFYKGHQMLLNGNKEHYLLMTPYNGCAPDVWILGSSGATTDLVIEEKLNYAMSLIHTGPDTYHRNKDSFLAFSDKYEAAHQSKATTNVTVAIICAETKQERDNITAQHGKNFTINITGDLNACYDQIHRVSEDFKTDEILLKIFSPDPKSKLDIIENLADKFQLPKTHEISTL